MWALSLRAPSLALRTTPSLVISGAARRTRILLRRLRRLGSVFLGAEAKQVGEVHSLSTVETKKHVSATTRNKVCGAKFLQMVAWLSSLDLCRSAGFGTAMISRTRPLGNQVESDPARFEIAALWAKTAVISASESGRQPGVDRTPAQPVESGSDG